MSTYAQLQTDVAQWVHRTDIAAKIPTFILFAENRIHRDLRLRCMEEALSGTITSGVLAVPDDYLELKHAYVDSDIAQKLGRKSPEWIYEYYPTRITGGAPKFIAREGEEFIFGPYPDDGYTIKGVYYKQLAPLSNSNTSNWFTESAYDLILAAACAEASEYSRDATGLAYWTGKYDTIKAQVQRRDNLEQFSGSILQSTAR